MTNESKKPRRGRPPSDFNLEFARMSPERRAELLSHSEVNAELIGDPIENAAALAKTRREIMKYFQANGSKEANEVRRDQRAVRLSAILKVLGDPNRNLRNLSNLRVAQILSSELCLSVNTLRVDVAEIRKLSGPTS